jgi:hypothetical protein
MDEQAWPFLIGRTRTQDHRIVVIPDLMTTATLASALRSSIGSGSPGPPDSVQIREIQGKLGVRFTVIYRVTMARGDDWGLPGGEVLTDVQGRPILLTEGMVLSRPATAVRQDGITQEDLDLAHSLVVPAYLEFWARGPDFTGQAAESFRLARSGTPVAVSPRSSPVPRVSARPEASGPLEYVIPPPAKRTEDAAAGKPARPDAPAPAVPTGPAAKRSRSRRKALAAAVAGVAAAASAALLAALLLKGSGPAGPVSSPARTLSDLCTALRSGDPARGYAETTSAYQHETTEREFAAKLLPPGKPAALRCSYRVQANPGPATASASMTITEGLRGHSWQVTLIKSNGTAWQVAAIR